jgi:hypothetical protein
MRSTARWAVAVGFVGSIVLTSSIRTDRDAVVAQTRTHVVMTV